MTEDNPELKPQKRLFQENWLWSKTWTSTEMLQRMNTEQRPSYMVKRTYEWYSRTVSGKTQN